MKCLIAVAAACACVPANAQPVVVTGEPTDVRVVSYSDLDLGNPADVERLMRRLKGASASICLNSTSDGIRIETIERNCYNRAYGRAREEVQRAVALRADRPNLAATSVVVVHSR